MLNLDIGIVESVLIFVVILYSLILHEISHGTMALILGDTTARDMGRLSLNPLRHLDPIGSVLVPLFLITSSSLSNILSHTNAKPIIFGWAKPVITIPPRLKTQMRDMTLIALAGPFSNFLLAFLFTMVLKFAYILNFSANTINFISIIIWYNCLMCVFNLTPLPPFDGRQLLYVIIRNRKIESFLNRFSMVFLLIVVFLCFNVVLFMASLLFNFLIKLI